MKMRRLSLQLFLLFSFIGLQCNSSVAIENSKAYHMSKRVANVTTRFEAIYQFGDSFSDTGNLVQIVGSRAPSANLPYGQTFGRPTGRSSDGLLMVDYFAMSLDLPLLNPILANGSDFRHGANFATASGTALDGAALATRNISLRLANVSLAFQLGWFNAHLHTICDNPPACKEKLQNSLVLVGEIGGNDFNLAFFQGKTLNDAYKLVPQVVNTIKHAVEEMIKLGVVNIVVPGNIPIGCLPAYLVLFGTNDTSKYDDLQCLKEYNDFVRFYNIQLRRAIFELKLKYPGVAIAYGDYYSAMTRVLRHASFLGFDKDELHTTCCGMGNNSYNFDPTRPCGSPGVSVCSDPNKRVNWDGTHLTQQTYKYMASWLLRQFLPQLRRVHV